jgi:hypothetical protein
VKYLIERDLYMSKAADFINKKVKEGYKLHSIIATETEEGVSKSGKKLNITNKMTLIFEKI